MGRNETRLERLERSFPEPHPLDGLDPAELRIGHAMVKIAIAEKTGRPVDEAWTRLVEAAPPETLARIEQVQLRWVCPEIRPANWGQPLK